MGALPTHRQATAVPDSLEAANFDFAFDVLGYVSSEVSFNCVVLVDEVAYFDYFFISEVAHAGSSANIERFAYI
mgnify:CR=1 FL=1|jgi:hypothetical protein|tara:strand:+ start:1947 stop:2168 length:222 start_codon:yes stop_codon:yes gene_type:complete